MKAVFPFAAKDQTEGLPRRAQLQSSFGLSALVRGELFKKRGWQINRATASGCLRLFKTPTLPVPDKGTPDLSRAMFKVNG
ncbi:MAG TPA: hypothetical protein VGC66_24425 [Pyrinomonadaceae bacterium]